MKIIESIPLGNLISHQCRNLQIHCDWVLCICQASIHYFNMRSKKDVKRFAAAPLGELDIIEAAFYSVEELVLIIVLTTSSILIYNVKTEALLQSMNIQQYMGGNLSTFPKGLIQWNEFLLAGLSDGCILSLEYCNGKFNYLRTLTEHMGMVCDFAKDSKYLASGDDEGVVILWDQKLNLSKILRFETTISSLVLHNSVAIVGDIEGRIHMRSISDSTLYISIDAHSRCISSLDIHSQLLLSVAEDGVARIWNISSDDIHNFGEYIIDNGLIQGGVWIDNNLFATTCYERSDVVFYSIA